MSMEEQLGRIEGKLDIIVPLVQTNSDRITVVEKKVAKHTGVLATLSVVFAAIMGFFTDW